MLKSSTMALIILNSRLSLSASSKIFKLNENELLDYLETSEIWYSLKEPVEYLFYFETNINDEKRDKIALFKANALIYKLNTILSLKSEELKNGEYQKFIEYLKMDDITSLEISYETHKTKDVIHRILQYKLIYALSSNELAEIFKVDRKTIYNWIEKEENIKLKENLRKLDDFVTDRYIAHRK